MKTLDQFIKENNGKQVEVTGSANAKFQCVDLVNLYIRDVLGLPIVEWTNAQDFPKKCLPPKYEYILNGESNFPLKGDIVVWSSKDNVGHIAVCTENGNINNFKSFDQNWSKPLYCTLETHVYTGTTHKVIGWLRAVKSLDTNMTEDEKRILQFLSEQGANEGKVREAFGALADASGKEEQIRILNEQVSLLKEKILELSSTVDTLNDRIVEYGKVNDNWQKDFKTANEQLTKTLADLEKMTTEKTDYRRRYEELLSKSVDKLTGWELIAEGIKKLFVKK